jgi:hypothetical protein
MMQRRRFTLALAALPAACAMTERDSAPARPVPLPTVRVGDRWRYQQINRYNGAWVDEPTFEVVESEPEIRLQVSGRRSVATQMERFSSAWSVIDDPIYDIPISFAQPMPIVPIPIQAGQALNSQTTYRALGYGDTLRWTQRLSAERWERVQVPAGVFDCLRIVRVIAFTHPDVFRDNSTRTDTVWYAPDVNRWVQREWTGDFLSSGTPSGFAMVGTRMREDWYLWQLTAYLPAPTAK